MTNALSLLLVLMTAAPAQPAVKLVPYVYSPAAPADLGGVWTVDPRQSARLFPGRTLPGERVFEARVEYRGATARTRAGDVTIRVYPRDQFNNSTSIYGNLSTRAYRYPGHRCTGEFRMEAESRRVVEWRGLCGQGRDPQTLPLRLVRS